MRENTIDNHDTTDNEPVPPSNTLRNDNKTNLVSEQEV